MHPRYKEGWNDRVNVHPNGNRQANEYGKAFKNDAGYHANADEAKKWTNEERVEYVNGWDAAGAAIAALVLP